MQTKTKIPYKLIIKICAVVMIVFFFIPTFTVSCSGQEVSISPVGATFGYEIEDYGQISDPALGLLFLLAIPIALLVIVFRKGMQDKTIQLVTLILSVLDFIIYLAFKSGVTNAAEEVYATASNRFGFYIDIIVSLGLAVVSALVMFGVLETSDGGPAKIAAGKWTCPSCGNDSNTGGFCGKCGTSKPAAPAPAAGGFCPSCGAPMAAGAQFCGSCGAKTAAAAPTAQATPEAPAAAPTDTNNVQ